MHKNISSAKRRVLRNYPSIFTSLFSQFNRLNILSSAAVNNLGEKLSPSLTPLLILIFSLSLCRCTVTELSVFQDFYVRIFYSTPQELQPTLQESRRMGLKMNIAKSKVMVVDNTPINVNNVLIENVEGIV